MSYLLTSTILYSAIGSITVLSGLIIVYLNK